MWYSTKNHISVFFKLFLGNSSFALVVTLIFTLAPAYATETEENRIKKKQKIEEDITRHQINIQRLNQGLETQKEGVEKTFLQEKGILAEIENIERRLIETGNRLNQLERRMSEQQELIRTKSETLKEVKRKKKIVQLHLQKRMGAYYKLGKIDFINITFSTQTLPELLKFHDSFQNVLKYDQGVITNYRDTITELEGAKEALILEQGLLEEFISQANQEKEVIKTTRDAKERLLVRIKSQAHLHKQAINELEKAQDELTASLAELKKKDELMDQGFFLNKGKHNAPIEGKIISLFNQERVNNFGINRKNPGISFDAPDGTKIRAIYDAVVLYSGYLRGYGNTVILDHSYQYYSIVSRIERLLVTQGMKIKSGDILGIMGETATIMDDGLYFEIRHKENSLDPLKWLNIGSLTFQLDK